MTTITKLRVAHAICMNLVHDTSMNDPRMAAIIGVRDGIAESITELEQPKGL